MLQTILRVDAPPLVVETYQMSKSIFQSKLPIPLFKLLKSIFYPNEICTFKYTHMQFPFLDREGGILISDICSIIIYVQRPLYKCSSAGLHRIKSKLTFHNAPSIWTGISIKVNSSISTKKKLRIIFGHEADFPTVSIISSWNYLLFINLSLKGN